jgi:hypothetical protein
MPEELSPYFTSFEHAMHMGMLQGRLLEAGFVAEIVTDDQGNYTDVIEIIIASVPYHPTRVSLRVLPPSEPSD